MWLFWQENANVIQRCLKQYSFQAEYFCQILIIITFFFKRQRAQWAHWIIRKLSWSFNCTKNGYKRVCAARVRRLFAQRYNLRLSPISCTFYRQVISQLTSSSDIGAFQGDEAVDGSGSGDSPSWRQHVNGETDDDEDGHGDDRDDDEASGSGMGPTTTGNYIYSASRAAFRIDLHFDDPAPIYSRRRALLLDELCVPRGIEYRYS